MPSTRTRRTVRPAAERFAQQVEFTSMVLANGTCTRPTVTVGQRSCVGTVLHAQDDAATTGVWEVVDHSTGNPAVYRSMPTRRYSVALVQNSRHGVVRSHTFHTDSRQQAWGYLQRVAAMVPGHDRQVGAWALVCSA